MSTRYNKNGSVSTLHGPLKIVVLGDACVGKTSLINKLINKTFVKNYVPTVEDIYNYEQELTDGKRLTLEILDTSGYYEFPAMRELNIRLSGACVLIFDLTKEDTLDRLTNLYDLIVKFKVDKFYPLVLVGNKNDLCAENSKLSIKANDLAKNWLNCAYFEVSAKNDSNKVIQKIFDYLIDQRLQEELRLEAIAILADSQRRSSSVFSRKISIRTSIATTPRRLSEPKKNSMPRTSLKFKFFKKKNENCIIS